MKNFTRALLAGTSLVVLMGASGATPAYAALVELNTTGAISAGTSTVITDITNPVLNAGQGTATAPTFTTTGIHNHQVTIDGTLVANSNNDALGIYGNNTHGFADITTVVSLAASANAVGSGTGAGIRYASTGTNNFLLIGVGAEAASGADAGSAGILVDTTQSMTITNSGIVTGVGPSALQNASTQIGSISYTNYASGTTQASGTGSAINMVAGAGNFNFELLNNGYISAQQTAIKLTHGASSNNTLTLQTGTIISGNAAAPVIDVSGVTSGYTLINLQGGRINANGDSEGLAVKMGRVSDVLTITGGSITGKVVTGTAGQSEVDVNASSGFSTGGDFGTTSAALHRVSILGGTATISHNIYANAVYFTGGTATLNANISTGVTNIVFDSGTLNLKTNTLSVGNTSLLTANASSGVLAVTLGAEGNGKISSSGTFTNDLLTPSKTLAITATLSGRTATVGDKYVLLHGTTDKTNLVLTGLSSGLFGGWSLQAATSGTDAYGNAITGNNVVLAYTAIGLGLTPNQNNAITGSMAGGAPAGVSGAVNALTTEGEAAEAGDKLRTEINRGSIEGAMASLQGAQSTIEMRLSDLRSGVSTGESSVGAGAWVQGFGFSGVQGARYDANGYKAKAGGVTFGIDKEIAKQVRVGGAFTYGGTSVDHSGVNAGNTLEIKSYQGSLYSSYQGAPWYVNGAFNLGFHKYDTARLVDFSGFADVASAKHDGFSYAFKADGGYPFAVGAGVTVTPTIGFAYTHLDQEAYTETSASGSALSVGSLSSQSIKSSLGGKVSTNIVRATYKVTPEFRAAWQHEFDRKGLTTTASYVDGGASFTTTQIKPEANSALVGMGVTLKTLDNISFTAGYNAELREKYVGHTGSLQVRCDF